MLYPRGYRVPKGDSEETDALVEALTVEPRMDFMPDQEPIRFCVCMETQRHLYLPKHYGLQRFGPGSALPEPTRVNLTFRGELLPNQREPVEAYLRYAHDPKEMGGILTLPPGYGKTVIALHLVARLGVKTLVLVHKEFLMHQWMERIEGYLPGARVGMIKQAKVQVDADIVIASVQSVSMRNYPPETFEGFGLVIVDECHHMAASVFSRALPKATFRYTMGLTATLTRKDGLSRVLHWFMGKVVFKVACKQSVPCDVRTIPYLPESSREEGLYGHELSLRNGKPNITRMINVLAETPGRTAFVVRTIVELLREEPTRNVIVLSDRRHHLETMREALGHQGVCDTGLYVGGMKNELLERSKASRVLLGTYAMVSEGFDLPKLDTLVLSTPKSDVEQAVGRIQRKHEITADDNPPLVLDVVDDYSVFRKQAARRRGFYEKRKYTIRGNA